MGKFKEGPPEVVPHVVFEEMAAVAHKHGYGIEYGVTLCYWIGGETFSCTVRRPEIVSERESKDG